MDGELRGEDLVNGPLLSPEQRDRVLTAEAMHALLLAHLPLAHSITTQYCRRCYTEDRRDLFSAALWGLWQATERFEPDRGVRFSTFAHRRVHGAVQDYLRGQDPLSRHDRRRVGHEAGPWFVSIQTARNALMEDTPWPDPFLRRRILLAIRRLPCRERVIVLGLLRDRHDKDAAIRLGVSQTRVSQLKRKALIRLRDTLESVIDGDHR